MVPRRTQSHGAGRRAPARRGPPRRGRRGNASHPAVGVLLTGAFGRAIVAVRGDKSGGAPAQAPSVAGSVRRAGLRVGGTTQRRARRQPTSQSDAQAAAVQL